MATQTTQVANAQRSIAASEWRPAPPPDPILLRRLKKLRYERGATVVGLVVVYGALLTFLGRHTSAFIGASFGVTGYVLSWAWTRRARPDVAPLMDLPSPIQQFPVDVIYLAKGQAYGQDSGILSFIDSVVHFQGLRTDFDLQRGSSWATLDVPGGKKGNVRRTALKLSSFSLNRYDFSVSVLPFDQVASMGKGNLKAFEAVADEWMARPPQGSFTVIHPPTSPMPELPGILLLRMRLLIGISAVSFAVSLLAYRFESSSAEGICVTAFMLTLVAAWLAVKHRSRLNVVRGLAIESERFAPSSTLHS